MLDKYTSMTQFEGIEPEKAAASFGFDTGYAYAIRAVPPDGKTQDALEREMAQVEQLVSHTHLRSLFRRHWLKGYHYWHVCLLAKEWLERAYQEREVVALQTRQLGDHEHDPWACTYRMVDPISREDFDSTIIVYWVQAVEGRAVNWWMVAPSSVPDGKARHTQQPEDIFIRVLASCDTTLLQITARLKKARFIMFIHSKTDEMDHCTHLLKHAVQNQAILCDGDIGTIVVHAGTDEAPQEQKITFQVIDGELADIDNPHGFPLHVKVVI